MPLTTAARAAAALGRTIDDLATPPGVPRLTQPSTHFRSEAVNWSQPAQAQLAHLDGLLRFYSELLDELNVGSFALLESPFSAATRRPARDEAERAARRVRDHLGLANGTVPAVFDLADRDVLTFRLPLGTDLSSSPSGLFFKDQRVGLCTVVNADLTVGRQHFTWAHELAHAYFHSHREGGVVSMNGAPEARERFANDFAREFLMPADLVHTLVDTLPDWSNQPNRPGVVLQLQRIFQVSFIAMAVRLRTLGLLTTDDLEALGGLSPSGLARQLGLPVSPLDRRPTPLHPFEQIPASYRWLLVSALEEGVVTAGDVAENLLVSTEDVRRLMDDAPAADSAELALNQADLALGR